MVQTGMKHINSKAKKSLIAIGENDQAGMPSDSWGETEGFVKLSQYTLENIQTKTQQNLVSS
jgi:hypothetical protein